MEILIILLVITGLLTLYWWLKFYQKDMENRINFNNWKSAERVICMYDSEFHKYIAKREQENIETSNSENFIGKAIAFLMK